MSPDLLREVGRLASELWVTAGVTARDDFLVADVQPPEQGQTFHRETGARAVIMAPIGLERPDHRDDLRPHGP